MWIKKFITLPLSIILSTIAFCLLGCHEENSRKTTLEDREGRIPEEKGTIVDYEKKLEFEKVWNFDYRQEWEEKLEDTSVITTTRLFANNNKLYFLTGEWFLGLPTNVESTKLLVVEKNKGEAISSFTLDRSRPGDFYISNEIAYIDAPHTAICTETGRELWRRERRGGGINAFSEDMIITRPSELRALDTSTGETLWNYKVHGYKRAALTAEGNVVFEIQRPREHIYKIGSLTGDGTLMWETSTDFKVQFNLLEYKNIIYGSVYANAESNQPLRKSKAFKPKLVAFDAQTGKHLWEFAASGLRSPTPFANDDIVFFAPAEELYALDAKTGKLIWKRYLGQRVFNGGITVKEDTIYLSTYLLSTQEYTLFAIDKNSGKILGTNSFNDSIGAPVLTEELIIIPCEDGYVYALKAVEL